LANSVANSSRNSRKQHNHDGVWSLRPVQFPQQDILTAARLPTMKQLDLMQILLDRKLAQFGDSFVNFVYSLALTRSQGRPVGTKVSDKVLAVAAQKAGIRKLLPKRTPRGDVSNAVEALVVYAWLHNQMTIDDASAILEAQMDSPSDAFATLSKKILEKLIDE